MSEIKKILEKLQKFGNNMPLRTKSRNLNLLFVILTLSFGFFNIYFSQNISPIFFGLSNNNKKSTIEYLQKIRKLPDFDQQLKYFEKIYGLSIKNDIFAKEINRELKIKQLEQILDKNSQARDVLYSLYLLNLEKGDKTHAEKYLKLAREVDLTIK